MRWFGHVDFLFGILYACVCCMHWFCMFGHAGCMQKAAKCTIVFACNLNVYCIIFAAFYANTLHVKSMPNACCTVSIFVPKACNMRAVLFCAFRVHFGMQFCMHGFVVCIFLCLLAFCMCIARHESHANCVLYCPVLFVSAFWRAVLFGCLACIGRTCCLSFWDVV